MAGNGVLVQPEGTRLLDTDELWRQLMQLVGRDLGLADWGSAINHVSFASNAAYAHTLQNQGTGGHLNVPNEVQIKSDGTGTAIRALAVSGGLTLDGGLVVTSGGAAITGNLGLNGDLVFAPVDTHDIGSGAARPRDVFLARDLAVGRNAGITGTLNAGAATVASLNATGAIVAGDTVQGTRLISTVAVGTAPLTVTSTTAVPNLNASLLGGLARAGFAELTGAAFSGSVSVSTNALNVDAAANKVRINSASVSGWDLTVGTGGILAEGASRFQGALTVSTGGLAVLAGGAAITGTAAVTGAFSASLSSSFNAGLSIAGGLSVTTGAVDFATAATSASGTAATAAGALVLAFGSGGLGLYVSTGAPTVTAPVGSLCTSTGGSGVANRLYVSKGAGNWASVSTTT